MRLNTQHLELFVRWRSTPGIRDLAWSALVYSVKKVVSLKRDEEKQCSLTSGKLADINVLNTNPLTISEHELADLEVEMTLVDGEVRYRAE